MKKNKNIQNLNGKISPIGRVSGAQIPEALKKTFFLDTIAKYCDKCGTPYIPDNLTIVTESNFSSIIHFSCNNCKSNHIATFIKPMGVSSRAPINSDLSVAELKKFAKLEGISPNDVLDVYELLEESDYIKY